MPRSTNFTAASLRLVYSPRARRRASDSAQLRGGWSATFPNRDSRIGRASGGSHRRAKGGSRVAVPAAHRRPAADATRAVKRSRLLSAASSSPLFVRCHRTTSIAADRKSTPPEVVRRRRRRLLVAAASWYRHLFPSGYRQRRRQVLWVRWATRSPADRWLNHKAMGHRWECKTAFREIGNDTCICDSHRRNSAAMSGSVTACC